MFKVQFLLGRDSFWTLVDLTFTGYQDAWAYGDDMVRREKSIRDFDVVPEVE